jgi:hypothetical protein
MGKPSANYYAKLMPTAASPEKACFSPFFLRFAYFSIAF